MSVPHARPLQRLGCLLLSTQKEEQRNCCGGRTCGTLTSSSPLLGPKSCLSDGCLRRLLCVRVTSSNALPCLHTHACMVYPAHTYTPPCSHSSHCSAAASACLAIHPPSPPSLTCSWRTPVRRSCRSCTQQAAEARVAAVATTTTSGTMTSCDCECL